MAAGKYEGVFEAATGYSMKQRRLRGRNRYTFLQLHNLTGIGCARLNMIEDGRIKPTPNEIRKIDRVLKTNISLTSQYLT